MSDDTLTKSPWLSRKEATAYLRSLNYPIQPQTLANFVKNGTAGKGPPFKSFGGRVVQYHEDDLKEWAERRMRIVR